MDQKAIAVAGVCSCNHENSNIASSWQFRWVSIWSQEQTLRLRSVRRSCNGHPVNTHYIYGMTTEEFHSTLNQNEPPGSLDPLLLALWYDAKGDWRKSHEIVQDIDTKEAALIHAYLHRKEGDTGNADYWYHRAGTKRNNHSIEEEWDSLVARFIS